MKRNETIAFNGNVEMLSDTVKSIVKVFDKRSVLFEDNSTATSKMIKSELESAGFHWWSFET